ncbi:hypothetical protein Psi02_47970 [Planotetraspora silvatica]|uniref:Integral membrane protein n=1 Tax=Planotetraspora silvatica TaxID=234614 RepID=A0A8J3UM29_9ACTN|nr:hypothetical protein [Planotetraspora silvatica]GII48373.1 hypothetical protein Psi02_47970 [Planotetraspora silvatica]
MAVSETESVSGLVAGLVPPEPHSDGVTEIRLHGVGGASPRSLLGEYPLQQVGGDAIAGFYRRPDGEGRHIEAYSWGGLTSRSGARVLWLLLLPFLLANLAGWMFPSRLLDRPRTFAVYRAAVRWAALAVTLNAVLFLTWIPVDYLGYQCGGRAECVDPWPLYGFGLQFGFVQDHPGRRILLAAAVPLLAIAIMIVLSRRTLGRYETVRPPARGPLPAPDPARSAAALTAGLAHPDFWNGRRATSRLGTAHLAAAVAMLAALIAHTVRSTVDVEQRPLAVGALMLSGIVLAGVAVALVAETAKRWPEKLAGTMLGFAVAALVLSAIFAWLQPAVAFVEGELPGMGQAVNLTNGAVAATLTLLLLAVLAGTALRTSGWLLLIATVAATLLALWVTDVAELTGVRMVAVLALAAGLGLAGQVARRSYDRFRWAAPFVVMALAAGVLNVFMLGLLIRVADTVGAIHYSETDYLLPPEEPVIAVFQVIRPFAPYLVLLPGAVLLLFLLWQGVLIWRAASGPTAERTRQAYLAQERDGAPPLDGPAEWVASTVSDPAVQDPAVHDWLRVRPWARTVAAWQRIGRSPLDLDLLFTAVVVAGVFLVASMQLDDAGGAPPWMIGLGTTVAAALPPLLIVLLRSGWSDLGRRKVIGVLWDVGTFWPRSYHPFAPPSYAERAVPELQRRIWWLHDNGGRILLTAHSQGSVLAAAALAQPDRRSPDDRVSLVTFGAPVHKLYNWGFPAYFNQDVLSRLRIERWENLYYLTDYVGGPAAVGAACDDVEIPDPPTSTFRYGEPAPRVGSHTGYWDDPALWKAVGQAAALLAARRTPVEESQV